MKRMLVSTLALLVVGALTAAGCSTFNTPAPAAESYPGYWGTTGPSGTPGELAPGSSSSGY